MPKKRNVWRHPVLWTIFYLAYPLLFFIIGLSSAIYFAFVYHTLEGFTEGLWGFSFWIFFMIPLGLIRYVGGPELNPLATMSIVFAVFYYTVIGIVIWGIKDSKHWKWLIAVLILLWLCSFAGCAQIVGPMAP